MAYVIKLELRHLNLKAQTPPDLFSGDMDWTAAYVHIHPPGQPPAITLLLEAGYEFFRAEPQPHATWALLLFDSAVVEIDPYIYHEPLSFGLPAYNYTHPLPLAPEPGVPTLLACHLASTLSPFSCQFQLTWQQAGQLHCWQFTEKGWAQIEPL